MREKDSLPGICYTDPNGVVRGPFDEWRILDWYRQGFFSNNIHFKLENDDVQFSLGELVDRFGQENPFSARNNWRVVENGAPLSISPEEFDSCCTECRRNGEKLDALLTAVHRLQITVDANSERIITNNQNISGLRTLFEESRWSAWTWNSNGMAKENGTLSAPGLMLLEQERNAECAEKSRDPYLRDEKQLTKEVLAPLIPATAWADECLESTIVEVASSVEANVKSEVAPESEKITPVKKVEIRDTTPKSSPLLERIRKRECIQNGEKTRKGRKSPDDWISANTKPSGPASFHPFPTATHHTSHQNSTQSAPWPGLHHPSHIGHHWGHNSFAPLQQIHYRDSPSSPRSNGSVGPGGHSFAAAALKKDKENAVKKDSSDEGGPRMVPVRTAQRVVMRRAPQKK